MFSFGANLGCQDHPTCPPSKPAKTLSISEVTGLLFVVFLTICTEYQPGRRKRGPCSVLGAAEPAAVGWWVMVFVRRMVQGGSLEPPRQFGGVISEIHAVGSKTPNGRHRRC